jgi:hypothetical protein
VNHASGKIASTFFNSLLGGKMEVTKYAYFRDEIIWRGRMIVFTHGLTATLYELGAWVAAILGAYAISGKWEYAPLLVASGACVRMLMACIDERQAATRAERGERSQNSF